MTWRDDLLAARSDGYDVLDWLSARQDRGGEVHVVACLVRAGDPSDGVLVTAPAPVPSVADLFGSAAWHERETSEMFAVDFAGHPDPRPLLLGSGHQPPLRRDVPLPARLGPWPGAVDPAKPRRAQKPPGTPWQ